MMIGGWFGLIIFVLVIYMVINLTNGTIVNNKDETPLSILNKRYANGEIDDEEYLKKKNLLNK